MSAKLSLKIFTLMIGKYGRIPTTQDHIIFISKLSWEDTSFPIQESIKALDKTWDWKIDNTCYHTVT